MVHIKSINAYNKPSYLCHYRRIQRPGEIQPADDMRLPMQFAEPAELYSAFSNVLMALTHASDRLSRPSTRVSGVALQRLAKTSDQQAGETIAKKNGGGVFVNVKFVTE